MLKPMKRTQIYLEPAQFSALKRIAARKGSPIKSVSDGIRAAITAYLKKAPSTDE